MSILENREACFNQEKLPTTYLNFPHKSLLRPKSKSPIDKYLNHKLQDQIFTER